MMMVTWLTLLLQQAGPTSVLVPQVGRPANDFAFSADDQFIVSAEGNLWETATGRMIWSSPISPKAVAISRDGNRLLFCGADGSRVWDRQSKQLLGSMSFMAAKDTTCDWASFLSDGRLFVRRSSGVELHNAKNFSGDRQWRTYPDFSVTGVTLMPDEEQVAFVYQKAADRRANIQRSYLAIGKRDELKVIRELEVPGLAMWNEIAVSADGKHAVVSETHSRTLVVDLEKLEILHRFDHSAASIHPDGKRFAIARTVDKTSGELELRDFATGKIVATRRFSGLAVKTGFSHAGDRLALLHYADEGRLDLFETSNLAHLRTFGGNKQEATSLSYSMDGRYLAVAAKSEGVVRIWDLHQARLDRLINLKEMLPTQKFGDRVTRALFANEDKQLVIDRAEDLVVMQLQPLQVAHRIKRAKESPLPRLAVDRQHHRVAWMPEPSVVEVLDLRSGQPLGRVNTTIDELELVSGPEMLINAVSDKNDNLIVERWSSATLQPLAPLRWAPNLSGPKDSRVTYGNTQHVQASLDGKSIVLSTPIFNHVIDLTSGAKIDLPAPLDDLQGAGLAAIAPNGNTLVRVTSRGKGARLSKQEPRTSTGLGLLLPTEPTDIVFHPTDASMFAVSGQAVHVWSGKRTSMTLLASGNDWIAFNDDGVFDASANGAQLVLMARGNEVFNIDQFAVQKNRPDVLLESLGLGDEETRAFFARTAEKRRKKLNVPTPSDTVVLPISRINEAKAQDTDVWLEGDCSIPSGRVVRYQIFVNGVPHKELSNYSGAIKENVPLQNGLNRIELSCLSEAGVESERALREVSAVVPVKPDLYFLGFGVSAYQRPELKLKYAAKDALDLETRFKSMRGFGAVHTKVLTDSAVSATSIKQAQGFAAKARVDDVFVLFIAGHGMHDEAEVPQYFYLTAKSDPKNLSKTAVPFETIESVLGNIKPRQKLFLMDTCESGEVDELDLGAGTSGVMRARNARGLRKKGSAPTVSRDYLLNRERFIFNDLSRRTGAIVFSSSRGGEFSYETDELQNGVFSESVLQALTSPHADVDKSGSVSTNELRSYVAAEVARRTNNLQHPVVDRDNVHARFEFPLR